MAGSLSRSCCSPTPGIGRGQRLRKCSCTSMVAIAQALLLTALLSAVCIDASRIADSRGRWGQHRADQIRSKHGGSSLHSSRYPPTQLKQRNAAAASGAAGAEAEASRALAGGKPGLAAAAAAAAARAGVSGRSLKQLTGFDPYGYGYYDPYIAGVTPGFINLDINRETGLHVGVGDVAVDVSADKNYYGLGIGNALGLGAARDRGWNLQLGGGNVLDVSVTKDAGVGVWALDGLLNINIGPDGKQWEMNQLAAQGSINEVVSAAPTQITSVEVDDTTVSDAGATQVVVDDTTTQSTTYPTYSSGGTAEVNPAVNPSAAYPASVAYPSYSAVGATEEQSYPTYSADGSTEVDPPYPTYSSGGTEETATYTAETEAAPTYSSGGEPTGSTGVETTLPAYDFVESLDYDATQNYTVQGMNAANSNPQSYLVTRPAAPVEEDNALWSTASQYSDTAKMGARLARAAPAGVATGPGITHPPAAAAAAGPVPATAAAAPAAAAAAPRRACEGGEQVWVSGSKFKCKYKKVKLVRVASGLNTYASGVAVR